MSKQANPDLDKKKLDPKGQFPQENMQSQAHAGASDTKRKGFPFTGRAGQISVALGSWAGRCTMARV